MQKRKKIGGTRSYNPAYMISTAGQKVSKETYLAVMFQELWEARTELRPRPGDTLRSYHANLGMRRGLRSFMAAQVVADLKYVSPLREASDWQTFAASGPGSRRGLNRVLDRPVKSYWQEDDWWLKLRHVQDWLNDQLRWDEPLHAQDVQNCLCEFDKIERIRNGEGRPKQKYDGGAP
jgi:hypothetical protein